MADEWRTVPSYPLYKVSNKGRVIRKGMPNARFKKHKEDTLLRNSISPEGYLRCGVRDSSGKFFTVYVHRLVAEAFIGNIPNKYTVNHIDCDKTNNNVSNLEIVSYSDNIIHAFNNGLMVRPKGSAHPHSKLDETGVLWIRHWISAGFSRKDIAKSFCVSTRTIGDINVGKTWGHL